MAVFVTCHRYAGYADMPCYCVTLRRGAPLRCYAVIDDAAAIARALMLQRRRRYDITDARAVRVVMMALVMRYDTRAADGNIDALIAMITAAAFTPLRHA